MTYFNSLSDIKEWFVFVKCHDSCFCLHFWRKILRCWVILNHIFIFCFTHYSYNQISSKHIILYIRKGIGTCHIFDFRLLFMVCALFWQHHPCGKVSREVHLPIFCFIDYFWLLWIGQNRPWGNKYVDTIFWITFTLVLLHFLRIWVCFTLVLWMEIFVSITHIGHRYFELTIWFGKKILCVYNYNYCAWAKILCTNFWKEM